MPTNKQVRDAKLEAAFRAGYKSAADRARAFHPTKIESDEAHLETAWEEFVGAKVHFYE